MRFLYIILAITVLGLAGLFIFKGGLAVAESGPDYKVIEKADNIEIRQYDPSVIAEVTVDGNFKEASNRAFRILFKYISGENTAQKKISMTAPVRQESSQPSDTGKKIAMTAPVTQKKTADNGWSVAFYLPQDFTIDTAPQPNDPRVQIKPIAGKKMAAIQFSGSWGKDGFDEKEIALRTYLETQQIAYEDKPIIARYNAPFTPWFLKRNEVIFPLK